MFCFIQIMKLFKLSMLSINFKPEVMKKNLLLLKRFFLFSCFIGIVIVSNGQIQQIPNGNFENWEHKVLYEYPQDWLTADEPDISVSSTIKSADAQDGLYSLQLTTIADPSDDKPDRVADGFAVFGDFGEEGISGISFNNVVDKFHVFVKYDVNANDAAAIVVRLFDTGGDIISQKLKFLTETKTDEWEKVEMILPFPNGGEPVMASSVMVGFVSSFSTDVVEGLGLDEEYDIYTAKAGSMLMVDNLYFTLGESEDKITISNSSFEYWADKTVFEPIGWSSSNFYHEDVFPVSRTNDAFIGNYAAKVEVISTPYGDDGSGLHLGDGLFNNGGIPYTDSPKAVRFAYKYFPQLNDKGYVSVFLKGEPTESHPFDGFGVWHQISELEEEYKEVIQFYWYPEDFIHEKLEVQVIAGTKVGSVLYIDAIEFLETFLVKFKVEDINSEVIPHAKVEVDWYDNPFHVSFDGTVNIDYVVGTFNYTVTADGFEPKNGTFTVVDSDIDVNVTLQSFTVSAPDRTLQKLNTHPNPFTNYIYVNDNIVKVKVVSIQGVELFTHNQIVGNKVNLSNLPVGLYILILETNDGTQIVETIIKN
jgi:hypothetical protein